MVEALPETDEGTLAITSYDAVAERSARADALLVGCGLGKAAETQRLVRALLRRPGPPTVLDADGLNAFEGHADELAGAKAPLVLTPHTGELARLLGEAPDLTDRLALVRALATRWNAVLLLKGMPSVVGAPDGRAFIGPPPQPALATAGTGDVLAGTVAGLLAQGMEPAEAAVAALHVGSAAAEAWADGRAAAALVASDLLALYPRVLRDRFAPSAA
jgi:NAD(P)H-hydrate epimerase